MSLTKKEAEEKLREGFTLRHQYYGEEEYVFLNSNHKLQTEDGCVHGGFLGEFWQVYQKWEDGWEVCGRRELDMAEELLKNNTYQEALESVHTFSSPYYDMNGLYADSKPLKRGCYGSIRTEVKYGNNQPCPCGSEVKFKKCCKNKI